MQPVLQEAYVMLLFPLQPTPLQELHENRQGAQRRAAIAAEVEMERDEECTFRPDTSKHASSRPGAPYARLSLSGEVSKVLGWMAVLRSVLGGEGGRKLGARGVLLL